MYKSFVVRIYPDEVQESFFINQFGCCRFVFNTFLDVKKTVYSDSGKYLSFYDCSTMLTELKKSKDWLKRVDSQALIESLKNLENAFDRFFKHLSKYPRYKSKYNPVQSYKTNNINNNIRIMDKWIRLPKVGWIRFRTHQKISGKIQSVTVKQKASGKYFVSILCKDVTRHVFKSNDRSCGIDLGISRFVTINTGEIIPFPQQNKIIQLDKKIRRFQRKLSKKEIGSKNYNKIKKKIAIAYEKRHNILDYHFYKIAQRLTEKYQVISMETLNIKGMLKNSRLSRSIQEKSWHMFTRILEQKAYEHGRKLIHIDQWYPSSKTCNNCKYHKEDLTLNNRTWTCPQCGNRHDRDINAAKNIHQEGLKIINQIQY